ncbi:hypothetical protein TeGR_g8982, partial [Tetraparma gracilis]
MNNMFSGKRRPSLLELSQESKLRAPPSSHAHSPMRSRPDGSAYSGLGRGPPPFGVITTSVTNVFGRGLVTTALDINSTHLSTASATDPTVLLDMCLSMHADLDRAPDRVCSVGGLELACDVLGRYQDGGGTIASVLNAASVLLKACTVLEGRVRRGSDTLAKLAALSKDKLGALEEVFEVLRTSTGGEDCVLILKQLTMPIVGYGILFPDDFNRVAWDGSIAILCLDRPVDGSQTEQERSRTLSAVIRFATESAK